MADRTKKDEDGLDKRDSNPQEDAFDDLEEGELRETATPPPTGGQQSPDQQTAEVSHRRLDDAGDPQGGDKQARSESPSQGRLPQDSGRDGERSAAQQALETNDRHRHRTGHHQSRNRSRSPSRQDGLGQMRPPTRRASDSKSGHETALSHRRRPQAGTGVKGGGRVYGYDGGDERTLNQGGHQGGAAKDPAVERRMDELRREAWAAFQRRSRNDARNWGEFLQEWSEESKHTNRQREEAELQKLEAVKKALQKPKGEMPKKKKDGDDDEGTSDAGWRKYRNDDGLVMERV